MDLWLTPRDPRAQDLLGATEAGGAPGYGEFASPLGPSWALSRHGRLLALHFGKPPGPGTRKEEETGDLLRRAFQDPASVPLAAVGTAFQLDVWKFLRGMPGAVTLTYGEVARAIGRPGAARAVGGALGANPLALLIPCHRVVARGGCGGYRWGLERKLALLDWELLRRDPLTLPF